MLGVRLPEDIEEKLDQYVKRENITKSQFVKQAVSQFLRQDELRTMHHELTLQGFKEIKKGKGIPGAVVMRMMEKWS